MAAQETKFWSTKVSGNMPRDITYESWTPYVRLDTPAAGSNLFAMGIVTGPAQELSHPQHERRYSAWIPTTKIGYNKIVEDPGTINIWDISKPGLSFGVEPMGSLVRLTTMLGINWQLHVSPPDARWPNGNAPIAVAQVEPTDVSITATQEGTPLPAIVAPAQHIVLAGLRNILQCEYEQLLNQ